MNLNEMRINPFKEIGSDWALVTAGTKNGANMMTVSWGAVGVMWGKNVVFVFVRGSRYTKEFLDSGDTFSLSFFDEKYKPALSLCGSKSGRDIDKWAASGLTPCEKDGAVYPEEAKRSFLCKKLAAVPVTKEHILDPSVAPEWYPSNDYHTMYVGEIIEVRG
ncbi:MAG: flavin reductase [Clostridia bacterium]|nr:flavin reductase [Clostridia bacterium]